MLSTTTPTTDIYTLSLHDALPISHVRADAGRQAGLQEEGRLPRLRALQPRAVGRLRLGERPRRAPRLRRRARDLGRGAARSEEHTSELQSQSTLVCRLLLERRKGR